MSLVQNTSTVRTILVQTNFVRNTSTVRTSLVRQNISTVRISQVQNISTRRTSLVEKISTLRPSLVGNISTVRTSLVQNISVRRTSLIRNIGIINTTLVRNSNTVGTRLDYNISTGRLRLVQKHQYNNKEIGTSLGGNFSTVRTSLTQNTSITRTRVVPNISLINKNEFGTQYKYNKNMNVFRTKHQCGKNEFSNMNVLPCCHPDRPVVITFFISVKIVYFYIYDATVKCCKVYKTLLARHISKNIECSSEEKKWDGNRSIGMTHRVMPRSKSEVSTYEQQVFDISIRIQRRAQVTHGQNRTTGAIRFKTTQQHATVH
jgi:hypothetical protein